MTLYAFSTENWNRPKSEITLLFRYLDKFFKDNIADLMRDGVRVQVMGDITRLPKHSQKTVLEALNRTKDNNNYVFNIALNYGSRQELVKATKEIASLANINRRHLGTGPSDSESQSGGVASFIVSSPADTARASKKPIILVCLYAGSFDGCAGNFWMINHFTSLFRMSQIRLATSRSLTQ